MTASGRPRRRSSGWTTSRTGWSARGGRPAAGPSAGESPAAAEVARCREAFEAALDDDLNTSEALGALFDAVRATNAALDQGTADAPTIGNARALLDAFQAVFGIRPRGEASLPADLAALVEARQSARKERDFAEADRLRALRLEKGVVLEDTPQGVRWKRVG